MNEQLFEPKPEEVAPTLKTPDEVDLPFAETLKSDVMPNDGSNISTLIITKETFSQTDTLRSTEESGALVESGIREKSPDSVSVVGTAPISSKVISKESYPMEEVLEPSEKKPAGFKLQDVPEWEIRAKGTVPTSEKYDAPDQPSSYKDKGDETLRAA
jgi:hypothetical protein